MLVMTACHLIKNYLFTWIHRKYHEDGKMSENDVAYLHISG